jgi:hypothetical protein
MAETNVKPGVYALISCELTQYALDTKDGAGMPKHASFIRSIAEIPGPPVVAYPYIASESQQVHPLIFLTV